MIATGHPVLVGDFDVCPVALQNVLALPKGFPVGSGLKQAFAASGGQPPKTTKSVPAPLEELCVVFFGCCSW